MSVYDGYTEWASTYEGPNAMVEAEESIVHSVLEPFLNPGMVALDAGCGTGRHSAWLACQGCKTIGIDLSSAMLERAVTNVPSGRFVQASVEEIPLASNSIDVAICALALCHLPDIAPAVKELGRVLRPSGRLLISDPHARGAYSGGQGFYGAGGVTRPRFVRNHHKQASEWIEAFLNNSLVIEKCIEPCLDPQMVQSHPVASYFPEATAAAFVGLPFLWVWSLINHGG